MRWARRVTIRVGAHPFPVLSISIVPRTTSRITSTLSCFIASTVAGSAARPAAPATSPPGPAATPSPSHPGGSNSETPGPAGSASRPGCPLSPASSPPTGTGPAKPDHDRSETLYFLIKGAPTRKSRPAVPQPGTSPDFYGAMRPGPVASFPGPLQGWSSAPPVPQN